MRRRKSANRSYSRPKIGVEKQLAEKEAILQNQLKEFSRLEDDLIDTKNSLELETENLKQAEEVRTKDRRLHGQEVQLLFKKINRKYAEKQIELDDLRRKYRLEESKSLWKTIRAQRNTTWELKGRIRVFCRVRPDDFSIVNKKSITAHPGDKKREQPLLGVFQGRTRFPRAFYLSLYICTSTPMILYRWDAACDTIEASAVRQDCASRWAVHGKLCP